MVVKCDRDFLHDCLKGNVRQASDGGQRKNRPPPPRLPKRRWRNHTWGHPFGTGGLDCAPLTWDRRASGYSSIGRAPYSPQGLMRVQSPLPAHPSLNPRPADCVTNRGTVKAGPRCGMDASPAHPWATACWVQTTGPLARPRNALLTTHEDKPQDLACPELQEGKGARDSQCCAEGIPVPLGGPSDTPRTGLDLPAASSATAALRAPQALPSLRYRGRREPGPGSSASRGEIGLLRTASDFPP